MVTNIRLDRNIHMAWKTTAENRYYEKGDSIKR